MNDPCQHEWHGDSHNFGRLNAGNAKIEPARSPLRGVTKKGDGNEKQQAKPIKRYSNFLQPCGWNLRKREHDESRKNKVAQMVEKTFGLLMTCTVDGKKTKASQADEDQKQGLVHGEETLP